MDLFLENLRYERGLSIILCPTIKKLGIRVISTIPFSIPILSVLLRRDCIFLVVLLREKTKLNNGGCIISNRNQRMTKLNVAAL